MMAISVAFELGTYSPSSSLGHVSCAETLGVIRSRVPMPQQHGIKEVHPLSGHELAMLDASQDTTHGVAPPVSGVTRWRCI